MHANSLKLYWSYYPHWSRDSLSPACGIFLYRYQNVLLHLIYFSGISMFFALFYLSMSEARPLYISVALGLSIHFRGTSSASQLVTKISSFSLPKTKQIITVGLQFNIFFIYGNSCTQVHSPTIPPSSSI